MSSWIWNRLRPTPPNLHKVTVFETASCGAMFDGRHCVQLEHVFCQINAQCCNLHGGRSCLFKWLLSASTLAHYDAVRVGASIPLLAHARQAQRHYLTHEANALRSERPSHESTKPRQRFNRISAARAWACRPSPWASTLAIWPRVWAPCSLTSMMLLRF